VGDSFAVRLRQASTVVVDKPRILLHKIDLSAQREGAGPGAALEAFERWLRALPADRFQHHERVIARAMRSTPGRDPHHPWIARVRVARAQGGVF